MFTADRIGATRIWVREDTEAFLLHPDCYEAFKAAWMKGEAFFVGKDVYGDEVVVKLGTVTFLHRGTPESAAKSREEAKEMKQAQKFEDLDG